jgi:hypothetical protein
LERGEHSFQAIFRIDAYARHLGGCWGATERNDPPNPGTQWDGRETKVQLSGMVPGSGGIV